MPTALTSRQQLALGLLLALTMILTHAHTISSMHHLPSTSWAVFFLAGVFIRRAWPFYAFCGLAAAIDYVAITFGSVSSFCVTPAYAMLLPCYGALWLGGRWYARGHRDHFATLPRLTFAVVASAFVAELFSSGGFYFLGGRFAEPTLAGFLPRLANYFPGMLGAMAVYVAAAAVAYAAWVAARQPDPDGPRMLARTFGHGMQAAVFQFIKGSGGTSEHVYFRRDPSVRWEACGAGFTWETQDRAKDIAAARTGWDKARQALADPASASSCATR